VVVLAATLLLGDTRLAVAQQLERTVSEYATKHAFSGTILVEGNNSILYRGSFGLADRAFGAPVTEETRFKIASITKAFTAVLILQLHERGRLDLHAPIRRYLPDYAGEGADRVNVHQLLNHTSGIDNFDQVKSFDEAVSRGIPSYQLPQTPDELVTKYASGRLVHEPGTAFDYNNADYVILGKIIERVTGTSYRAALERQILEPLRLTSSGVLYHRDIVPKLASTYLVLEGGSRVINDLPVYPENWYAAGAMYSTAPDVLAFARALFGGKLLRPETLRLMLTPGLDEYGYGLWVPTVKAGGTPRRVAQRPGRIMGANAVLLRYLDDDLTIIILGNTDAMDVDAFAYHIGNAILE
jgi:D-alanyl-D-alanine carboxypeptidase